MLQHGLTVGTLAEFYPEQHNLLGLNVNGGEKIFLRLRRHFDEGTFLDEEEVVFIMLHELAVRKPRHRKREHKTACILDRLTCIVHSTTSMAHTMKDLIAFLVH